MSNRKMLDKSTWLFPMIIKCWLWLQVRSWVYLNDAMDQIKVCTGLNKWKVLKQFSDFRTNHFLLKQLGLIFLVPSPFLRTAMKVEGTGNARSYNGCLPSSNWLTNKYLKYLGWNLLTFRYFKEFQVSYSVSLYSPIYWLDFYQRWESNYNTCQRYSSSTSFYLSPQIIV